MRCKYCHNPDTWATDDGEDDGSQLMSPSQVLKTAMRYKAYWKQTGGITVSGRRSPFTDRFCYRTFQAFA